MPLYTVFAPLPRAGESAPDPVDFVFVKDGFCWPALIFGELWLLYRRLWLVLLFYVAFVLGLSVAAAELGGAIPGIVYLFGRLLLALEGNSLRRWKLRSRGYSFVGVVEGRRKEADLRFFAEWRPVMAPVPAAAPTPTVEEPPPPPPPSADAEKKPASEPPKSPAPPQKASDEAGQVIGLFPSPGGAT